MPSFETNNFIRLKLFNIRIRIEIIKAILIPPKTAPRSLFIIPKDIILTILVIPFAAIIIDSAITKKVIRKEKIFMLPSDQSNVWLNKVLA